MAIAFRSGSNTSYGNSTNTTLTAPAGIANGDILVAAIFTGISGTPPTPTLSGWAAFGTTTLVNDTSFFGRLTILWKRAASESGSYTFTHTNCSSQGWMGAFSGCVATGTPLGATSNNSGNYPPGSGTSTGTGITTAANGAWLLFIEHDWVGAASMSPPSGMTERLDSLVYIATEARATAGATGDRSTTNGNGAGAPWAVRMVELLLTAPATDIPNKTVMPRQGLVRASYW